MLIGVDELKANLSNWQILSVTDNAIYDKAHIPGALQVDRALLFQASGEPLFKRPCQKTFSTLFSDLGLDDTKRILIYDEANGLIAGRLFWLLHVMGRTDIDYLNGGLNAWLKAKGPVTQEPSLPQTTSTASWNYTDTPVMLGEQLLDVVDNADTRYVLWDTRSEEEFSGKLARSARGGHIPGAIWYEWTRCIHPESGMLLPLETLRVELEKVGITPDKIVVPYCHSNRRSAFAFMAAKLLAFPNVKAYEGSWAEWGNLEETPIA